MVRRCQHCQCPLPTSRRNPNQRFCSKKDCQKARKSQWQRDKMRNDPDYRLNQKQANKDWQKRNPGYWRQYRQRHPEYAQRNRDMTRQRVTMQRQLSSALGLFAKMDAFKDQTQRLSGYYGLIPFGEMFAKMDAKLVKINLFQDDPGQPVPVCKERTVSSLGPRPC